MNLFSKIDRHSITYKISLRVGLSALLLVVLLCIVNTYFVHREYQEMEQGMLSIIMEDALKTLGVNLSYEFYEAVKETGDNLLKNRNILHVRINSKTKGEVFSCSHSSQNFQDGFLRSMAIVDPATGENIGKLTVTYSQEHYRAMMLKYYRNLAILLLIYFIFVIYLIRLLVISLRPLGELARQMHSFSPDKKKMRLPYHPERKDEISHIAWAGNAMLDNIYDYADRQELLKNELIKASNELEKRVEDRTRELKEKQMQLTHAGRLVALGELAAGIAHELGQPLQIIKTAAAILIEEMADDGMDRHEVLAIAGKIMPQVDRASAIINNIRIFARYDMGTEITAVDLRKPLEKCLAFFHEQFHQHEIKVSIDIAAKLPKVRTEPQKFQQIVVNLLANARYAVDNKYQPENINPDYEKAIQIKLFDDKVKDKVILEVIDNGKGMNREELDRCLDPFFTTKPPDKGTGLGLSIAYGIASEFGFKLEISSVEGQGSIFRIKMDGVKQGKEDGNQGA
jgi:signal transduction histidine kinase